MKKSTAVLLAGSLFLLFVVIFSMYLAASVPNQLLTGILSSIVDIGRFIIFAAMIAAAILAMRRLLDWVRAYILGNRQKR